MKRVNEIYQTVDRFVEHHGAMMQFAADKAYDQRILHSVMKELHESATPVYNELHWDQITIVLSRLPKYVRNDFIGLLTRLELLKADVDLNMKSTDHLKRYVVMAKALGQMPFEGPLDDIEEASLDSTIGSNSDGDGFASTDSDSDECEHTMRGPGR